MFNYFGVFFIIKFVMYNSRRLNIFCQFIIGNTLDIIHYNIKKQ